MPTISAIRDIAQNEETERERERDRDRDRDMYIQYKTDCCCSLLDDWDSM